MSQQSYDAIIIGGGAAGLMAASRASERGKKTLLLEHTGNLAEKIRISGGGRCNFTNLFASPANYISENPHFIKSALSQYSQHDFIKLVEKYKISYHEKTLGQLFCDGSSKQIISMLLNECLLGKAEIVYDCKIGNITKSDFFSIDTNLGNFKCRSLVIASGGLSIPKLGASNFGYEIAKKFGLNIIPPRPALVPLILDDIDKENFANLSGISIPSICSYEKTSFKENILFTHRGLSGPAILQISSYVKNPHNQRININLVPNIDLLQILQDPSHAKTQIGTILKPYFSNKFVLLFCMLNNIQPSKIIAEFKKTALIDLVNLLSSFPFIIQETEGYSKAEVTAGGVDTNELSSKTMEVKTISNLYFIGEVVDVTGWLGGYNFQWAWSSGFVAGNNV